MFVVQIIPTANTTYATPPLYILKLASVDTDAVKHYMYIGVGVGWQRRSKTCQSLRELDRVSFLFVSAFRRSP